MISSGIIKLTLIGGMIAIALVSGYVPGGPEFEKVLLSIFTQYPHLLDNFDGSLEDALQIAELIANQYGPQLTKAIATFIFSVFGR